MQARGRYWDMMHLAKVNEREMKKVYVTGDGWFQVELSTINHDKHDPSDPMHDWFASGYVSRFMNTSIAIRTCFIDYEGNAYAWFNPLEKPSRSGRNIIDFEWLLESTPQNEKILLRECERRYLHYRHG